MLVAGELGYTTGSVYTSLSGFCTRSDREWRHFGNLQLLLLAKALETRGYAFWNLGHPGMAYKRALGAQTLPRRKFLARWLEAIDAHTHPPAGGGRPSARRARRLTLELPRSTQFCL